MAKKPSYPEAQNPIVLNCHRLMEAFAKSNDERDFYLDKVEGFIIYANLDKDDEDLNTLDKEIETHKERYCLIPKFTFFETKKIMESFVHEKVYDIDTKEKLTEIIQSKEARENFLEFIFDHHAEFEKWQQFYQERSRVRIIEWLRQNNFHFVFEEDLDLTKSLLEKIKRNLFDAKVGKDVQTARKTLTNKAKTYYSNEALNPRPKRGRPPKQQAKQEIEPQFTVDIYTTVPSCVRPFLFTPDVNAPTAMTFSSKFDTEESFLSAREHQEPNEADTTLKTLNDKLANLRTLSNRWMKEEKSIFDEEEEGLLHPDSIKGREEEILKEFAEIVEKTETAEKGLNGHTVSKTAKKTAPAKEKPKKKRSIIKKPAAKKPKKEEPPKKKVRRIIRKPKAETKTKPKAKKNTKKS